MPVECQSSRQLERVVEVLGFVFGMSTYTFAIVGRSYGISSLSKVNALEVRLRETGILSADADSD